MSLADIVTWLREGTGRRLGLIPVPPLMRTPLQLAGCSQIAGSLFGHLEIDGPRFRDTFGWQAGRGHPGFRPRLSRYSTVTDLARLRG